jgi:general nucleoside transport system permease protein
VTAALAIVAAVVAIALIKATPLIYAGLGGTISENAGVVNIALEGMMVAGAFSAVLASYYTHNLAFALVAAVIAGALLAWLLAFFAVSLRADQIIVGMALNILAIGGAAYLLSTVFGQPGASPEVTSFASLGGEQAGGNELVSIVTHPQRYALFWLAVLLVVALQVFLYRTRAGVHLRAVGEEPRAAATAGINVVAYRYWATIAGGALAALGGAYLSIGEVDLYSDGMVAGRGFIALAAVIFGKWTPLGTVGACIFFGFFSSLQIALQRADIPAQLLEMLPYVLTIVAISGFIGKSRAPAADGIPYEP